MTGAKARVRLVVEIEVDEPWGADAPLGQVYKQAAHSAKLLLERRLTGKISDMAGINVRILEHSVEAIITEREE